MTPRATDSLWIEEAPATAYPALERDLEVDVAVIGGGIAGVTTALFCKQEGLQRRGAREGRDQRRRDRHEHREGQRAPGDAALRGPEDRRQGRARRLRAGQRRRARADGRARPRARDRLRVGAPARLHVRGVGGRGLDRRADRRGRAGGGAAGRAGRPTCRCRSTSPPRRGSPTRRSSSPRTYTRALAALVDGGGSHVFESTMVLGAERGHAARGPRRRRRHGPRAPRRRRDAVPAARPRRLLRAARGDALLHRRRQGAAQAPPEGDAHQRRAADALAALLRRLAAHRRRGPPDRRLEGPARALRAAHGVRPRALRDEGLPVPLVHAGRHARRQGPVHRRATTRAPTASGSRAASRSGG